MWVGGHRDNALTAAVRLVPFYFSHAGRGPFPLFLLRQADNRGERTTLSKQNARPLLLSPSQRSCAVPQRHDRRNRIQLFHLPRQGTAAVPNSFKNVNRISLSLSPSPYLTYDHRVPPFPSPILLHVDRTIKHKNRGRRVTQVRLNPTAEAG